MPPTVVTRAGAPRVPRISPLAPRPSWRRPRPARPTASGLPAGFMRHVKLARTTCPIELTGIACPVELAAKPTGVTPRVEPSGITDGSELPGITDSAEFSGVIDGAELPGITDRVETVSPADPGELTGVACGAKATGAAPIPWQVELVARDVTQGLGTGQVGRAIHVWVGTLLSGLPRVTALLRLCMRKEGTLSALSPAIPAPTPAAHYVYPCNR